MKNYISKYVNSELELNHEMSNYINLGYQGLSDTVKQGLYDDMDYQSWVQMSHDEETFRRERGGIDEKYQTNGVDLINHIEAFYDDNGTMIRSGVINLSEPTVSNKGNRKVFPIPSGNDGERLRALYKVGNYADNSIDKNELSEDMSTNNIDQNTTLAYNIIKNITDLLKDDMYVEPDEYGMTTPELLKAFFYNFDSVDDPTTGKIVGWKRGDIKTFTNRVKAYLSNNDIVAINDNGIDVANSNYPEVAKLLVKLDTL